MQLADCFLQRLKAVEAAELSVFDWTDQTSAHHQHA
jgi:hypothetical protein